MADGESPSYRIDDLVERAMQRNGLNSLLLDIKEGLGAIGADLRHVVRRQDELTRQHDDADASRRSIHERLNGISVQVSLMDATVERIAPLVDQNEARYQQSVGQKKLLTKGRVVIAGLVSSGGGITGLWHYWDAVRDFLHLR